MPSIETCKVRLWLLLALVLTGGCATQPTRPPVQPPTSTVSYSTNLKFKKAQQLSDQGEIEKALSIYYSISLSHPGDPLQGRAWYEMGRLYMKKGYTQLAEERFKKVVKRYPQSLWANSSLLELAWLAHEKGDDSQASVYLSQIETIRLSSLQMESYKKLLEILSYQPSSQPSWSNQKTQTANNTAINNETQAPVQYVGEENRPPSNEAGGYETLPPEYLAQKANEKSAYNATNSAVIGIWLPKNSSFPTLCQDVSRGTRLAAKTGGLGVVESDNVEELLQTKNLVGIVGGMETFAIQKVAPEIEKMSIPLVTPFVRVPFLVGISPMLFSTSYLLDQEADFAARTGRELHLSTAGIIYPDIPFGRVMASSFKSTWEKMGGTVILYRSYPQGTIDFTNMFDEMEQHNNVPQLLFLPCAWEDARLIIPQIAYHEFEGITVMGVSLWAMTPHLYISEDDTTTVLFSNTFSKASLYLPVQEFIVRYLKEYKTYPSALAAQAYDAAMALVTWYKSGMNTPLSKVRFRGITGMVGFSDTGKPLRMPFLLQIKQNGVVQLN